MSNHYRSNLANLPLGYEMPHPQVPRQYLGGPSSPVYKTSIVNPIDYVRNAQNNYTTDRDKTAEEEKEELPVFQCPKCPTKCTGPHARGNMSRHMRRHRQSEKKGSNLECPYCEAKFRRSDATLKHVRRYHPEVTVDIDDPRSMVPRALPKRQYEELQRITDLMLQIIGYDQMLYFMSNLGDVVRCTENERPGDQSTLGLRKAFEILAAAQDPKYFTKPTDGELTGTGSAEQQPLGTSYYLSSFDNAGPSNSTNQGPYTNTEDPGQQPQPEATNDSPPAKPGQMLFGCPVCKYHDLLSYPRTCDYEGATGLSSVIDHLSLKCHRTHIRSVSRCKTCWGFYFNDTGSCDNDHSSLLYGERLVQPRGARQESAWVALFLKVYPDAPAIPSPYVGDDRLVDSTSLPGSNPSMPGSNPSRVSFLPIRTPQTSTTDGTNGELSPDDFNAPVQSTSQWSENAISLATTCSLGAIGQLLQDGLLDGAIDPKFDYAQRLIHDNRGRLSETDRHYAARDLRTLTLRFMAHIHAHLDKPMSLPIV